MEVLERSELLESSEAFVVQMGGSGDLTFVLATQLPMGANPNMNPSCFPVLLWNRKEGLDCWAVS